MYRRRGGARKRAGTQSLILCWRGCVELVLCTSCCGNGSLFRQFPENAFVQVCQAGLWEMRLYVFVKRSLLGLVSDVQKSSVPTGVGGGLLETRFGPLAILIVEGVSF